MTNSEQTNSEETPKKPRKGSKAAIDAEMAANAQAAKAPLAETGEAPAAVLCPSCEAPHPDPNHPNLACLVCDHVWQPKAPSSAAPTPSWSADVREAEANAAPEWEWETSEEVIDIKLTPEDGLDLLRANGADEEAKASVDRAIDSMKSDLKDKKAESDAISARMKERNRTGLKGAQSKKAHWKVGTCFATNTVRYVDPITDRVVFERAVRADERQVALPLPTEERGQLALGDVDPSDMTDPEALLRAAAEGEADPADEPLDNDGSSDDLGADDGDAGDGEDEDDDL